MKWHRQVKAETYHLDKIIQKSGGIGQKIVVEIENAFKRENMVHI